MRKQTNNQHQHQNQQQIREQTSKQTSTSNHTRKQTNTIINNDAKKLNNLQYLLAIMRDSIGH
jgi:hypothetical protein